VNASRRVVLEVVLAAVASAACVASSLASRSTVVNPPVSDGEPATASVSYYPPLVMLAFLLLALAGSMWVVAIARWRRLRRQSQLLQSTKSVTLSP
jgi:hypothetical protein